MGIFGLLLCQVLILGWLGSNAVSPQSEAAGGSFHSTPGTRPQFSGLTEHYFASRRLKPRGRRPVNGPPRRGGAPHRPPGVNAGAITASRGRAVNGPRPREPVHGVPTPNAALRP